MKSIKTLLIANRGEIACRIIQSASALGIRTIAIYSDADSEALHTRLADQAYRVGSAEALHSYLNIPAIVELAKREDADAIHPGYGFLSENPAFADACAKASIRFVGPSAESMQALGNKSAARLLAVQLGIPVRKGYEGLDQDDQSLCRHAAEIGFPLMIKAAAGGGGRGMRAVDHEAQLLRAIHAARAEAKSAFGNDQLLLEAYVANARHVEIQILADHHGNVLSLYERDCSTQRRHQKIIEEAPAPGLAQVTREAMSEAAVRLAKAVRYHGAGTVEFLLGADGSFSLLEMNTRLQVEHPVTEAITGLDLVRLQLQIAQGHALPLRQEDIRIHGHAIEARLCAEDPDEQSLPQSGPLIDFRLPQLEHVRIDHGLVAGVDVPAHYDSMMAKLIAWGEDREQARLRLQSALQKIKLLGPVTNRSLLIEALDQAAFRSTVMHPITWLEQWSSQRGRSKASEHWFMASAACMLHHLNAAHSSLAGFQSGGQLADGGGVMRQTLRLHAERDGRRQGIIVRSAGLNCWFMTIEHATSEEWQRVQLAEPLNGLYRLDISGHRFDMLCRSAGGVWHIDALGFADNIRLNAANAIAQSTAATGITLIRSRMHGRVIALTVKVGDVVSRGQTLLQIEAMKIQHHIDAPQTGRVLDIAVQCQQQVSAGQGLIKIDSSL